MTRPRLAFSTIALSLLLASCSGGGSDAPPNLRLVDLVDPAAFEQVAAARPALEPQAKLDAAAWSAGPGVTNVAVRDGKVVGRTTDKNPVIVAPLPEWSDASDSVDSVEVTLSISAGDKVRASIGGGEEPDFERPVYSLKYDELQLKADIVASLGMQTIHIPYGATRGLANSKFLYLAPSNVADAEFEIESVSLVTTKERLASTPSGVAWQGLADIFMESIVAHAPESFEIEVSVPPGAWLDVSLGTLDGRPVTFEINAAGVDAPLLTETVTTPQRWASVRVDLEGVAGRAASLSFSLAADEENVVGLWGTPVLRTAGAEPDAPGEASPLLSGARPRNVILLQADTLRRDHLPFYGYDRDTAPMTAQLAAGGALFTANVSPATWTKIATPAVMTSLYPTSHTVASFSDRLPASAVTLAELFREAGFATLSYSSVPFTGKFTNLHQGYDVLHEAASKTVGGPKSAREYVDRLTDWIDDHPDTPFFAFLHVFDPHSPFEPRSPYNSRWADPARRDAHLERIKQLKPHESDFLYNQQLATAKHIRAAGVDADALIRYHQDWYDGSIRGMDVEIERLRQNLARHGLLDDTLIVFFSDHGEEFLEHGGVFHGQSVYGELTNVPLFFHWPAGLPSGVRIDETVRSIDIMPTVIEAARLRAPDGMQGQSLLPLMFAARDAGVDREALRTAAAQRGWSPAPAVAENVTVGDDKLRATAFVSGEWRLIHNTFIPQDDIPEYQRPEYELFQNDEDPLNLRNVAADHPDVVEKLKQELASWREAADAAKLSKEAATEGLSPAEIQRLKSLGYVQ